VRQERPSIHERRLLELVKSSPRFLLEHKSRFRYPDGIYMSGTPFLTDDTRIMSPFIASI